MKNSGNSDFLGIFLVSTSGTIFRFARTYVSTHWMGNSVTLNVMASMSSETHPLKQEEQRVLENVADTNLVNVLLASHDIQKQYAPSKHELSFHPSLVCL